jgi:hypothetical protein
MVKTYEQPKDEGMKEKVRVSMLFKIGAPGCQEDARRMRIIKLRSMLSAIEKGPIGMARD